MKGQAAHNLYDNSQKSFETYYHHRRISQLGHFYTSELKPFWEMSEIEYFDGANSCSIAYKKFPQSRRSPAVIVLPAVGEFMDKYMELVFDLFGEGYTVYIMDHRRQGRSHNPDDGAQKLDNHDFMHYQEDLHYFLNKIVAEPKAERHILAHGTGALITCCYAVDYGQTANSLILSAPTFLGNPRIHSFLDTVSDFIGQTPLAEHSLPFTSRGDWLYSYKNSGTKSRQRFRMIKSMLEEEPYLQVAGVSVRWINQILSAQQFLKDRSHQIQTPILLFQAGRDRRASLSGQKAFAEQAYHCKFVELHEACHEIYVERDFIRNYFLGQTLEFLKNQVKNS